jgi:predicted  nucleic acid-binding Zn-ribbon protein
MSKLGPRRNQFRARSAIRDAETDVARLTPIIEAINSALVAAEKEYAGLDERVCDVLERAAVTIGNGDDEYLHREALDEHHQKLFDKEILNGQRRLGQLNSTIEHLRILTAAFAARFPEIRTGGGN